MNLQLLIVGGGAAVGGGVFGTTFNAGGGGGGVYTHDDYPFISGSYAVVVGGVAIGGGNASSVGSISTAGGGQGYTPAHGGASGFGSAGGAWSGSGSGGAGGGGNGGAGSPNSGNTGGNGGPGTASSISGSSVTYGAGGRGGDGGVGNFDGGANTGNGGGGQGGQGGSGIVIIKYITAEFPTCTGGTKTTSGIYTIHTFTSSGTFVIPAVKVVGKIIRASINKIIGVYSSAREIYSSFLSSDANLVAHYRFEGNSNARIGSYNGTDTNMSYPQIDGKFGQVARFDGVSKIVFGNKVIPTTTAHTIYAWVKSSYTADYQTILQSDYWAASSSGVSWWVGITDGIIHYQFRNGAGGYSQASGSNICDGKWHLLVGTWDGTANANSQKLYIDGILYAQTTGIILDSTTTQNLELGTERGSYYFNGDMDDLAIFSRALTAVEVAKMYNTIKKLGRVVNL